MKSVQSCHADTDTHSSVEALWNLLSRDRKFMGPHFHDMLFNPDPTALLTGNRVECQT